MASPNRASPKCCPASGRLDARQIMKLAAYFHVHEPAVFLAEEKSPNGKVRQKGKEIGFRSQAETTA